MGHFHPLVKCTKEKPILLFMDNHISYLGYSFCVFAKENGIILQTLPSQTSHASQPLDRTIYGPFKCHLAESYANWMNEHPGQRVSIYEVPLLSKPAILRAFTARARVKRGDANRIRGKCQSDSPDRSRISCASRRNRAGKK